MINSNSKAFVFVAFVLLNLAGCSEDAISNTGLDTVNETDNLANPENPENPENPLDPTTLTDSSLIALFEPSGLIRIEEGSAGLDVGLSSGDRFGRDHDTAGDINGDGVIDRVVGARSDDDGGTDTGAVYILLMNADGTVNTAQKISALEGNFYEELNPGDFFGYGVAGIGDYDGDTIPDIAVSTPAANNPAIYIIHLNETGTVKSIVKNAGIVGQGLSAVGDLNRDGKIDLAAASPQASNGGQINILFFDESSEVIQNDTVTIGEGLGGFGSGLNSEDSFGGRESALLGDIDNDGSYELAVGAFTSDDGQGAVWILSLDEETLQVVDKQKIAPGLAGFDELIPMSTNANGTNGGHFGHALVAAGDLNGDGVPDLITSANQYDDGVVYIIYLNTDKTVKTFTRINSTEGGFDLTLDSSERFGRSLSVDNSDREDGKLILNVGGGAGDTGAVYALEFQSCNYTLQEDTMFWSGGETLFTNWDHNSQTVTGPLSFEQCALTAVANDSTKITTKADDGRCIVKDDTAALSFSTEGSSAYIRSCPN